MSLAGARHGVAARQRDERDGGKQYRDTVVRDWPCRGMGRGCLPIRASRSVSCWSRTSRRIRAARTWMQVFYCLPRSVKASIVTALGHASYRPNAPTLAPSSGVPSPERSRCRTGTRICVLRLCRRRLVFDAQPQAGGPASIAAVAASDRFSAVAHLPPLVVALRTCATRPAVKVHGRCLVPRNRSGRCRKRHRVRVLTRSRGETSTDVLVTSWFVRILTRQARAQGATVTLNRAAVRY